MLTVPYIARKPAVFHLDFKRLQPNLAVHSAYAQISHAWMPWHPLDDQRGGGVGGGADGQGQCGTAVGVAVGGVRGAVGDLAAGTRDAVH